LDVLEKEFGCVVIPLEANKGKGIKELKQAVISPLSRSALCEGRGAGGEGLLRGYALSSMDSTDVRHPHP